MRIGIDARFFGSIGKGLGRYTQKLIENLERIDKTNEYFIFLRKENFDEYKPQNPNFKKVLADYHWYTISEQIGFSRLLYKYNLDLMHFPHFNIPLLYRKKFVVTIHDLILIHFPTIKNTTLHPLLYKIKFLAYRITIRSAIKRSSRIITVSNFTKKDILENYKRIPQEKIIVTYEACEEYCMLSPNKDEEILKSYGIIKPYIMYVGNAYPHKNLERLVLAFSLLKERQPDLKLVLVGREDYFYLRLKDFVNEHKVPDVIFVGYAPDYELDTLFHNAEVYVFPSLYEGFGLPPLEAMSKGTPVASSNHPCMREILNDSACYFDGENVKEMAASIEKLIIDENLRRDLVKKGYLQIGRFNWKRMARETLRVYEKILG